MERKKYSTPEISVCNLILDDIIAVSSVDTEKDIFEFDDAFEDVFNK